MEEIKLGSLCITKIAKKFKTAYGEIIIPKGTSVLVCDDYCIEKGYVLTESDDYGFGFDYKIDELILTKNSL